jgi:hypothetical protein
MLSKKVMLAFLQPHCVANYIYILAKLLEISKVYVGFFEATLRS